jgi:hypothetical protein
VALLAAAAALPGWHQVATGPVGGTVWAGRIPDTFVTWDRRASAVYLPPGYSARRRYPVLYLLHGMSGSPASIYNGLQLASVADRAIATGQAPPFIAVMPVAGPRVDPNGGEWAGVWERYVVDDVVPWVDAHLPTEARPAGRALEGLCAGGYGALDIGLRHPGIFGMLGSWEGYFAPVFRDGPFVNATRSDLRGHDPTLLVHSQATALRQAGVRFLIAFGGDHGRIRAGWSAAFAQELGSLRLPHRTWLVPVAARRHLWRAMVPPALEYAFLNVRDAKTGKAVRRSEARPQVLLDRQHLTRSRRLEADSRHHGLRDAEGD